MRVQKDLNLITRRSKFANQYQYIMSPKPCIKVHAEILYYE